MELSLQMSLSSHGLAAHVERDPLPPRPPRFWLLGKDAVPLPEVPRLIQSTNSITGESASDLIVSPGTRLDILIQCNTPGSYVLASAAGPFHTNTTCGSSTL